MLITWVEFERVPGAPLDSEAKKLPFSVPGPGVQEVAVLDSPLPCQPGDVFMAAVELSGSGGLSAGLQRAQGAGPT